MKSLGMQIKSYKAHTALKHTPEMSKYNHTSQTAKTANADH